MIEHAVIAATAACKSTAEKTEDKKKKIASFDVMSAAVNNNSIKYIDEIVRESHRDEKKNLIFF